MEGIPPARASDNEDVIWALETAESLWKREARVDAIVWLRRAAQEAAEAGDDDRASALMVEAAALTETLTRMSAHARTAQPVTSPPPPNDEVGQITPVDDADLDALLASDGDAAEDAPKLEPAPRETTEVDEIEVLDDADLVSMAPPTPVPSGEPSQGDVDDLVLASEAGDLAATNAAVVIDAEDAEVEVEGVTSLGEGALSAMDLAGIAALSRMSDEQRESLVKAARVILCAASVEVPEFGFALVLDGEVSVAAEPGGPVIARVAAGAILRARSTLDVAVGGCFMVTTDDTTLALWTEASLASALESDPSIDQDLRASADRWLAWVSVARSPMASQLHEDVRHRLAERLTVRVLRPGAELVAAGQPVSGMLLVGYGSVSLDLEGAQPIRSGEFVFPEATMSAGRATVSASAGERGAVMLVADRRTTQELYATEPLLLELLAASC